MPGKFEIIQRGTAEELLHFKKIMFLVTQQIFFYESKNAIKESCRSTGLSRSLIQPTNFFNMPLNLKGAVLVIKLSL